MSGTKIGFAMCGSFCTFSKALPQMENLINKGYDVLPIMSDNAYKTDTRFGKAADFTEKIEKLCSKKIIHSIKEAEPMGPRNMCNIITIAPCTGNTLAKIANGITDTPVTMAVKSLLRIGKPVLIALATNDALGVSAQNLGKMLNFKNIYFVPVLQDDPVNKPNSLVARFDMLEESVTAALDGRQLRPVFR